MSKARGSIFSFWHALMLVRIFNFLSRSRIPIRAMSTSTPIAEIPEKRSQEEETEIGGVISALVGENQKTSEHAEPPGKSIKTGKDRKEYFNSKQSRKSQEWAAGGKKPVRDGPTPERKPKKK